MLRNEFVKLFINTNDGIFMPTYLYEQEVPMYDEQENIVDYELVGYTEILSAQEVYDKWLQDKENPTTQAPDKIQVLSTELRETNIYLTELELLILESSEGGRREWHKI